MSPDRPIWVGELELYAPRFGEVLVSADNAYPLARLLVRAAGTPVGFVEMDVVGGRVDLDSAAEKAAVRFEHAIAQAAPKFAGLGVSDAEDPLAWLNPSNTRVSVILCTRNRSDGARVCIESLRRTRHPAAEIIIVDNAPSDDSTEEMVREIAEGDPRVRYIREERPGLSRARNRGLAAASGDIVAFTDDDAIVDRLWLNGLLRGFARSETVACATGVVVSASLRHPAERYFDGRVWWSSSFVPVLYALTLTSMEPSMPYAAGKFGTGANFAFRRATILALGGFDNSLGAGSLTQGGEDLDAFVRLIRAGYAVSYEPSAVVHHYHRVDSASLARQMRGYGLGLGAYLTKYLLDARTRREILAKERAALRHLSVLVNRSNSATGDRELRRAVARAEFFGLLAGPLAYLRSRRQQDRDHVRAVAP